MMHHFIPLGAFGGKPSADSLARPKTRQYTDRVHFIFYSLSLYHINRAINRLEKLIDDDLLNKVLEDSVIGQLTDDQVQLVATEKMLCQARGVGIDVS